MVTIKEFENRKEWYLNDKFHREDGPAIEWSYGSKEWYLHGKLHRSDGPARELSHGTKEWYLNDKLHRTDGPAIEWSNGCKEWSNGTKEWYLHGKLHRIDGPAFEWSDGSKLWYLHNKLLYLPEIKAYQISRLRDLTLVLSPLELPPYVIFWILEWSESAYIADLDQRSVIKLLEGIMNSRQKLKNISI